MNSVALESSTTTSTEDLSVVKAAVTEASTSAEITPIDFKSALGTWRDVLQTMELTAAYCGVDPVLSQKQMDFCIGVLADNGRSVSSTIETRFAMLLSEAIADSTIRSVKGLILRSFTPEARSAIVELLKAFLAHTGRQPSSAPAASNDGTRVPKSVSNTSCDAQMPNQGAAGSVGPPTYDSLIGAHERGLRSVADKTIKNEISVLRRLMLMLKEDGGSSYLWMVELKSFQSRLSTIGPLNASDRSAINKVRATAISLAAAANPTQNLWESYVCAHHRYVSIGGKADLMSKNEFIKFCFNATGMSRKRLNASKILVHGGTFERIRELEHSLAADGDLTRWLINMSDNNTAKFRTAFGKRLSKALEFRYALLPEKWPKQLKEEWNGVYLLRTEPLKASRQWGLHLEKLDKRELYTWKIRRTDGSCASAVKQSRELECFFGWCLLPITLLPDGAKNVWRSGPDKHITIDQLSLALLADQDLFDGYLAFRKAHTLSEEDAITGMVGKFNRFCKTFIEFASSLFNPHTGFVALRKDLYYTPMSATASARNLAPKVGTTFYDYERDREITVKDESDRWVHFCKAIRSYMEITRQAEFDDTYVTRDMGPIANILKLPDPIVAIVDLLDELKKAEPVIEHWMHHHRRKRLFFMLESVCPLRVFQFALMTGTHLSRKAATPDRGAWYQIHFNKDEFKNERFIAEQDYYFDLPDDFTSFIDDFLNQSWPYLNKRPFTAKDRIFGTAAIGHNAVNYTKVQNANLCDQLKKICKKTTARFLGTKYQTPGFFPHAFRHIKATSVIKTTGSFDDAALFLWDSVITVKKAYAHIKRSEQLARAAANDYQRMKHIRSAKQM